MRSVPGHELQEGRAYRAGNGDLLLVTRVERLPPKLRYCVQDHAGNGAAYSSVETARVSFVWLGSVEPSVVDRYLGQEHSFTPTSELPHYYEEL